MLLALSLDKKYVICFAIKYAISYVFYWNISYDVIDAVCYIIRNAISYSIDISQAIAKAVPSANSLIIE